MGQHLKNFGLCFLTALLITMSFPRLSLWPLAWIALIPFLRALDGKTPAQGFRIGYCCGFLTFYGTLYWILWVTEWFSVIAAIGVFTLYLYLSLYYAVFGWVYCRTERDEPLLRLFVLPAVWVVLEWLRGWLFSGFDWISLGHSQWRNLLSIQIADVTGVAGISFLIVMTNVFLHERRFAKRYVGYGLYVTLFAMFMAAHLAYGIIRWTEPLPEETWKVGIAQGNIEQDKKWQEFAWPMIMNNYHGLTEQLAASGPDMIIWPETSFPGILGEDDELFAKVERLAFQVRTPLLVGAIEKRVEDYYNTVFIVGPDQVVHQQYDKIHLVPFGEFLPGRRFLGPLADIVPIADFTPGREPTVFRYEGQPPFSVLICFEDTVSRVARPFVQRGARVLVNMTNDAWFKDTKAATLHMSTALFRAVENRRSLVRATNTGVSAAIDPRGRLLRYVKDEQGRTIEVRGAMTVEVPLSDRRTFYTKFGNVFVFLCLLFILWTIWAKKTKIGFLNQNDSL
ncbi:MAG: apolipoprotein N-acyltransferase [Candidatus Omnitrophica bacterium]|nr:apolipoprotein N-acyltransferase [Candidatus Omnitrophota bacterium]